MYCVKTRNEGIFTQLEKKRKSFISQEKEVKLKKCFYPATFSLNHQYLHPSGDAKLNKSSFNRSTFVSKYSKKKTKSTKTSTFDKYIQRSILRKEIVDLENSLESFAKQLEERRKEKDKDITTSFLKEKEQNDWNPSSSSSIGKTKKKKSLIKKASKKAKPFLSGDDNSSKQRFFNELRADKNAGSKRNVIKLNERLERVRRFINTLKNRKIWPDLRNDGLNHKEPASKKNSVTTSGGPNSGTTQTVDSRTGRNSYQMKNNRRNRTLASRPPILETIIEEPEKIKNI